LLDSVLPRIKSRFEEGTIGQGTLLQFRQEQQAAHLARVQSESELRTAIATAAGIAGIPVPQLPELRRVEPIMTSCGPLAVLSPDSLQFLALASRWSVAAALAGYQVAEAELRLEIARQRPDLELGPGLFFDHGITRFLANFALPFLPGGNRGPIAEMEARRSTAAAHVASAQESVLVELDGALAQCGLIDAESRSADSVDATARARWSRTREAYDRGEVGELDVRLEGIAALRTHRLVVLANQHAAEGRSRLEAAVGVWSSDPAALWPDTLGQPARGQKEHQ
ncbi:MAG: TolC family protein, partial [Gemmatimonadota bacterium]